MRCPRSVLVLAAPALATFAIAACGGGGGGGGNPPAGGGGTNSTPFGINVRPVVAAFNLPSQIGQPTGFALENAFPNLSFTASVFLAGVPDGNPNVDRLVVVEQGGRVHVFDNDPATASTNTVLDLSGVVAFGGEEGLLGFAFDPDFVTNRYVYVHYSASLPRRSVISRFTWDVNTDVVVPATEKVILELEQPSSNHNGGMLAFGPDDDLYIGFGDGGGANDQFGNSQNPSTLHGNVLRIDVHPANPADPYAVPPDNPFVGTAGFRDEIWALGLRNPFRFSFDRQNGVLWLGDVGQGQWEEVDRIVRGANYGWPRFEGNHLFDAGTALAGGLPHTPPVTEYDHGQGNAVIGGYVYRGARFAALFGRYLFADYGSGNVWALDDSGPAAAVDLLTTVAGGPTSFGEDNAGEVYVVTGSGTVWQFAQSGGATLPDTLSATGLFTSLANLTPASGLIEYDLTVPFWSDSTFKRRWVAVPNGTTINFAATDEWDFPAGTVIVKHFEIALTEGDPTSRRRLETRVLVNGTDERFGFTYRWNAQGTDALLVAGRESEVLTINLPGGGQRQQRYDYPSRTDCLICHNEAAGFALGLLTRQLNREFDYPAATDNQLRTWNHINLFNVDVGNAGQYPAYPDLQDEGAELSARARAYLAVNCSQCHRPSGSTGVAIDLRFDTPQADMGVVGEIPQAGDLGLPGARIVAPGAKASSVLWERMRTLDGDQRMPPLASHVVDDAGVDLIGDWIDSL